VAARPNQESTELASSLTMAFLVLLEQLTPTERAVFLLREVFEMDFDEIARIVGKSEVNTRQILTRGRSRLRRPEPRFATTRRESEAAEALVERFRHAVATGDVQALMAVLDPEAQLVADGGGKVPSATRPIIGADRVARFLLGYASKLHSEVDFRPVSINGTPGLLLRHPLAGDGAYAFDIDFTKGGRIREIYVVRNPDKLRTFLKHVT
jgi:RNA polymerase sigma-70 factor (ECF subfamily)